MQPRTIGVLRIGAGRVGANLKAGVTSRRRGIEFARLEFTAKRPGPRTCWVARFVPTCLDECRPAWPTKGTSVTESPRSAKPHDGNIAWMLWERATRAGSRPAVIHAGSTTDYRSLCGRAGAFAAALADLGVGREDRVGVFLERNADAAAAFFGIVALGAIAVIVNENLRPRQIEHVLGNCGARALVTAPDLLARQHRPPETGASVLTTDRILPEAPYAPVGRIGTDVAQIIYTSGSTGPPKGVTLSHANLWAGTRAVTSYVGITRADRLASLLPFSFDYGFNQLLCAVLAGAALVVERSPVPQRIVATLHEQAVTVLAAVPPLWLQLLGTRTFYTTPLPALRAMTNTGGRLPVDAVRALRQAQPRAQVFLMYGLTEAFRSTYLPPDEVDEHPDSIGRAIPEAEILVLGEDLRPCAPGEIGELVHRGPTVALGYWNDPEASARVFPANPLRPAGAPDSERVVCSGDLVRRDEEGRLYFVARKDMLIKSLGYRVSADEVVSALYASGEILEAVVTSEPDPLLGERIVAHIVLTDSGSVERLEAFCVVELPRYLRPGRFDVRRAIPRAPSGKHDVRALVEP